VVFSGGTTMFPGIADHMQKELTALLSEYKGQDCCSSQTQVLCLDWWFYSHIT
jgi:actin-related protein